MTVNADFSTAFPVLTETPQKLLPGIDAPQTNAAPPARLRVGADPAVKAARTAFHFALAQDRPDLAKVHQKQLYQALEDFQRRKKNANNSALLTEGGK